VLGYAEKAPYSTHSVIQMNSTYMLFVNCATVWGHSLVPDSHQSFPVTGSKTLPLSSGSEQSKFVTRQLLDHTQAQNTGYLNPRASIAWSPSIAFPTILGGSAITNSSSVTQPNALSPKHGTAKAGLPLM
jgi:hypothetical protein